MKFEWYKFNYYRINKKWDWKNSTVMMNDLITDWSDLDNKKQEVNK